MSNIMGKPLRIQRTRKHKMVSPNDLDVVYVGRPTKWGNPNRIIKGNAKLAVGMYDAMLALMKEKAPDMYQFFLEPLKGKNLSCWCPLDQPCHGDLLLELSNN